MNEYTNINVWDVTFCKHDDDGNTLLNEDGTVQLFHAPKMDYSNISEYVEEEDLIYIEEEDEDDLLIDEEEDGE